MGWVKKETMATRDIFNDLVAKQIWNGRFKGSSSPYEYFSDRIRDYYDVTLSQCDTLCKMLKEYYKIDKFYYGE